MGAVMRIAIYSRKSKWTGKGESIENQLIMCKEYVMVNFPDTNLSDIYEYEDEGFSGKTTQRPQFQKMMSDLRSKHYDFLVCYKLDRLGRNLSDLVNLIEELNKIETSFISIKEKFDTSTPIGRAMMFFTGVLAQMEREQIAERVKDNMLMLARSGRWLGGATPLGFISKKDEIKAFNNKVKTSYRLAIDEKEVDTVKFIFYNFLDKQSLTQLETYFIQNNIKTRNGKEYQISSIRDILTNPVYCTADMDSFDYFEQLGCQVCIEKEELDGVLGLIGYGKTSSVKYKNKQNDPSEWVISVAKHKGIIRGKEWVRVQQILESNKKKGDNFRKVQNPVSLLSGILYCNCGYPMRPKNFSAKRIDAKGNRTFAYLCSLKEKSNRKKCEVANIPGNTLDQLVCDEILAYVKPDFSVSKDLQKLRDGLEMKQSNQINEIEMLKKIQKDKNNRINQLMVSLSKADGNNTFLKYIEQQVSQLDRECKEIEILIAQSTIGENQTRINQTRVYETRDYQTSDNQMCDNQTRDNQKRENQTRENQMRDNQIKENQISDDQNQIEMVGEQISSFAKSFEMLSVLEKREYLRTVLERVVWDGENVHIYFHNATIALPQPLGPTIARNSPSIT
ncbi:MAG: recombinase family protein [Mobilitalea sp.]